MKKLILALAVLILAISCSKYEFDFEGSTSERLFYSNLVDDEFNIYTYLPAHYNSDHEYPVVFLLDGDWYFEDFTRELNDLILGNNIEPTILIGVGYKKNAEEKRFRDYTFPSDPEYDITNGEADVFSRFLQEELIPDIQTKFSTDSTNYILAGHSLGGLHTLYNMFVPGTRFNSFVAVSSSIWWSNGHLFGIEERFHSASADLPAKAFISVGGDEPPSMTILNEELIERLTTRNYNGFTLQSKFFNKASHSQVPMIGFRNGLQFVLN